MNFDSNRRSRVASTFFLSLMVYFSAYGSNQTFHSKNGVVTRLDSGFSQLTVINAGNWIETSTSSLEIGTIDDVLIQRPAITLQWRKALNGEEELKIRKKFSNNILELTMIIPSLNPSRFAIKRSAERIYFRDVCDETQPNPKDSAGDIYSVALKQPVSKLPGLVDSSCRTARKSEQDIDTAMELVRRPNFIRCVSKLRSEKGEFAFIGPALPRIASALSAFSVLGQPGPANSVQKLRCEDNASSSKKAQYSESGGVITLFRSATPSSSSDIAKSLIHESLHGAHVNESNILSLWKCCSVEGATGASGCNYSRGSKDLTTPNSQYRVASERADKPARLIAHDLHVSPAGQPSQTIPDNPQNERATDAYFQAHETADARILARAETLLQQVGIPQAEAAPSQYMADTSSINDQSASGNANASASVQQNTRSSHSSRHPASPSNYESTGQMKTELVASQSDTGLGLPRGPGAAVKLGGVQPPESVADKNSELDPSSSNQSDIAVTARIPRALSAPRTKQPKPQLSGAVTKQPADAPEVSNASAALSGSSAGPSTSLVRPVQALAEELNRLGGSRLMKPAFQKVLSQRRIRVQGFGNQNYGSPLPDAEVIKYDAKTKRFLPPGAANDQAT